LKEECWVGGGEGGGGVARKVNNTVTTTHIFSSMIRSSTLKIILLFLNNSPQNRQIQTLFSAHMSILLMPAKQVSCSCKETLSKAQKRMKKNERSLEK